MAWVISNRESSTPDETWGHDFYRRLDKLANIFDRDYLDRFQADHIHGDLFDLCRQVQNSIVPDLITRDSAWTAPLYSLAKADKFKVRGDLAAVMDFMVEIAPDNQPPDLDLTDGPIIEDQFWKIFFVQVLNQVRPHLTDTGQGRDYLAILAAAFYLNYPRFATDRLETGIFQFLEEPFVAIDQMLGQVGKTHSIRQRAPVFLALRDRIQSFKSRFPDCLGKFWKPQSFRW